jgi:hypothetical protein
MRVARVEACYRWSEPLSRSEPRTLAQGRPYAETEPPLSGLPGAAPRRRDRVQPECDDLAWELCPTTDGELWT